jgi:hypothetical protein
MDRLIVEVFRARSKVPVARQLVPGSEPGDDNTWRRLLVKRAVEEIIGFAYLPSRVCIENAASATTNPNAIRQGNHGMSNFMLASMPIPMAEAVESP